MSTSMLQAYLAMRGPGVDLEDPLFDWIRTQDETNLEDGDPGYVCLYVTCRSAD